MKKVIMQTIAWALVGIVSTGFSATLLESLKGKVTYVVAADGSGNFKTVGEAISAATDNKAGKIIIFIKNGIYNEKVEIPKTREGVTLIGEDWKKTVITNDNYVGDGKIYEGIYAKKKGLPTELGTCHTLFAYANDFSLFNLTVENPATKAQAVAIDLNADKQLIVHCRVIGNQDCLYTWGKGRFYVKDSYIEGTTDFIFGRGSALFENTTIHCKKNSYIAAASTDKDWKFGYLFKDCTLTAASGITNVFLGRPWKTYSQMVYMNCELGSFIQPAGWSPWGGPSNTKESFVAEYKCTGPGADTTSRAKWSKQLSDAQAATYTMSNMFAANVNPSAFSSDWNPDLENNDIYKIIYKHIGVTGKK